jgi:hypothetical protein
MVDGVSVTENTAENCSTSVPPWQQLSSSRRCLSKHALTKPNMNADLTVTAECERPLKSGLLQALKVVPAWQCTSKPYSSSNSKRSAYWCNHNRRRRTLDFRVCT